MNLRRALPFVRQHRSKLFVVKLGGACLARPATRKVLAEELAILDALGARVVVVHGSGPQTDAYQRALGEEPRKVDGRRITTPTGLRALRLATCGELNGELAAAITACGARAVGVNAATANLLVADRRPPVMHGDQPVDFGDVGDVRSVDPTPLYALLDAGCIPVLSPPASDGRGGFLNVNADLAAAHVALAVGADKLVLATDQPGILQDLSDPSSVLSTLSLGDLQRLEEDGVLAGGMRVKSVATRLALEGGVKRVHVVSGVERDALLGELYTTEGTGTLIECEAAAANASQEPSVVPAPAAGAAAHEVLT